MDFTHVLWRKSSHSFNGADCVEIAAGVQVIAVRDSKNPEGAKLAFSRREWAAFAGKIKSIPLS